MKDDTCLDALPDLRGPERAEEVELRRAGAATLSAQRPAYDVPSNQDNEIFDRRPMAFTKGLFHDANGQANGDHYRMLADALTYNDASGAPGTVAGVPTAESTGYTPACSPRSGGDFAFRAWDAPLAGHHFAHCGPDADALAVAPAPKFADSEVIAEMAELYAMAILRDMPFEELQTGTGILWHYAEDGATKVPYQRANGSDATVQHLVDALNELEWFSGTPRSSLRGSNHWSDLSALESRRRAARGTPSGLLTPQTLFRGSTPGANDGDYVSQFLTLGCKFGSHGSREGLIPLGAQCLDQRILPSTPGLDYMTSWQEWRDAQNGVDLGAGEARLDTRAFVAAPRHLAAYVHYDQMHAAYQAAALLLIHSQKVPFQQSLSGTSTPNSLEQTALFATLSQAAERAIQVAHRQKFQIHRRARPERLAAMLTLFANGHGHVLDKHSQRVLANMLRALGAAPRFGGKMSMLMRWVSEYNSVQNSAEAARRRHYRVEDIDGAPQIDAAKNFLLPQAYPGGAPMHPSYGSGHAAVAGACVTILKAAFLLHDVYGEPRSMGCLPGGSPIQTIEGELNKLASNISRARSFAGTNFYSDYFEGLRLGERVAVGLLQEQMLTSVTPAAMRLSSFDGDDLRICTTGGPNTGSVKVRVNGLESDFARWWARPFFEFGVPIHDVADVLSNSGNTTYRRTA